MDWPDGLETGGVRPYLYTGGGLEAEVDRSGLWDLLWMRRALFAWVVTCDDGSGGVRWIPLRGEQVGLRTSDFGLLWIEAEVGSSVDDGSFQDSKKRLI